MLFYLTTLNLAHILKEECPKPANPDSRESLLTVETWKQYDFFCRNYILNRLDDTLYDIYLVYSTAKEVWDSLEKKYKTEDAGAKKFVIEKFLKHVMMDSKPMTKQVEEIQILIERCPWSLILRLRIEEDHRKGDKNDTPSMEAKANMIEGSSSKSKFQKNKGKKKVRGAGNTMAPKGKNFKRIRGSCWVCRKPGHKAKDCYFRKGQNDANSLKNKEANMVEENVQHMDTDEDNLVAVVTEVNVVFNVKGWWIDTGATKHICSNENLFCEYNKITNGEQF
ncbi:uncharacterized protein [Coffea arabica]|uniref:CCHC-type domain-containing protein n=1 Tax=Coffea arabica TaxID=13443 RepID=A0ABM4VQN1_COFAR